MSERVAKINNRGYKPYSHSTVAQALACDIVSLTIVVIIITNINLPIPQILYTVFNSSRIKDFTRVFSILCKTISAPALQWFHINNLFLPSVPLVVLYK